MNEVLKKNPLLYVVLLLLASGTGSVGAPRLMSALGGEPAIQPADVYQRVLLMESRLTTITSNEERIRAVETGVAVQAARYEDVLRALERIERKLDNMEAP